MIIFKILTIKHLNNIWTYKHLKSENKYPHGREGPALVHFKTCVCRMDTFMLLRNLWKSQI